MTTTPPETPAKAPPPWEKNPDGTALLLSEVSDDKGENKRLKLVYLRHVLLWLMQVEGLHFSIAARDMHKKLTGLAGLGLYLLEAGGNASPVGGGDRFNLGREIHQRRFSGGGLDADYQPIPIKRHAKQPPKFVLPEGVTLGQSAALYFWERVVGGGEFTESDFDKPGWQGTKLAISCEQAAQLWGDLVVESEQASNTPATAEKTAQAVAEVLVLVPRPLEIPKASEGTAEVAVLSDSGGATATGHKWTSERLAKLLADFKATPGKTVKARRAVLAKKWGLGEANIKKYLAKANVEAKQKTQNAQNDNLWSGLKK